MQYFHGRIHVPVACHKWKGTQPITYWRTIQMNKQDLNYKEYVEIAEGIYWVGFFLTKVQVFTAILT